MTRKVSSPQLRIPTNTWSGLHLSKSADFEALKKTEVRHVWFINRLFTCCFLLPMSYQPVMAFYRLCFSLFNVLASKNGRANRNRTIFE